MVAPVTGFWDSLLTDISIISSYSVNVSSNALLILGRGKGIKFVTQLITQSRVFQNRFKFFLECRIVEKIGFEVAQ
ncbi:hypothetical protein D3C77_625760 [compost metagenome]